METPDEKDQNIMGMHNGIMKLISKKSLFQYKYDSGDDSTTYTCEVCQDRYSFKSSYDYHMNRSSFNISYYCEQCKDTIIFTNKCKLHSHINSHPKTFLSISNITVTPPSAEDLLAKYSDLFKDSSYAFATKKFDTTKIVTIDQSFNSILEELSKNNDTIGMENNVNVDKNVNVKEAIAIEKSKNRHLNSNTQAITYCPICYDFFNMINDSSCMDLIFNHLQYLDDSKSFQHICKHCKRFLPNKCAMIAHNRMHLNNFPYICPECGYIMSSFPIFEKHLNEVCFHNSRTMVVKCVKEKCEFMCFERDVEKHFMSHMKSLFKCNECRETFDIKEQLLMHSKIIHQRESEITESVLECQVCMRIIAKNKESSHTLSHFKNAIKANYLYICEGCKFYFSKILKFKQHLSKCTPYIKKKKDFSLTNNKEIKDSPNMSDIVENVSNVEINTKEINDLSKISDIVEKNNNVKKKNKETKDFKISDVIEKVVDININTIIPNTSQIDSEFIEISEKKTISNDENSTNVRVFKNKQSQPTKISPSKSLKRKRKLWGKKKVRVLESKTFDAGITLTNVLKSDYFQCCKCDFSSSFKEEFHEHIMTHRDVCSDYQCMECGACFSTKKTFSMHLLVNHNIIQSSSYIRLNNCYIGGVEKRELETSMETAADQTKVNLTKEEFQCDICAAPFLNVPDLEKHFRSHGMAFLMTNKRQ